ncbi:hypothetical protein ABW19_dt0202710 [Dactylella cylindrospora]|nr:hypothetical protein ABW19_dt0202710 [Dactylella cylindrospora]
MGSQILRNKAPSAPAKSLAPNYLALVTPVLQRRFVRASGTTLLIAYAGNLLMENTSPWSWSILAFSRALFNCLILFASLIPVLLLRVSQVNKPSTKGLSDIHGLVSALFDFTIFKCFFWYTLSASSIILFYIWNSVPSSDLSIATGEAYYQKLHLNERPIYLFVYALPLGAIQALIHVWTDRGYLRLQVENKTFWEAFSESSVKSIQRIGTSIIASVVSGPFFYWGCGFVFRSFARTVFRPFYKLEPDTPQWAIGKQIDILFRTVWLTTLIIIAWEITNISVTVEFERGPIREGKTISEVSPDPNGSLILGLKLKTKPFFRQIAYRELSYIANEVPSRRETIFKDLTKPVSAWQQILTECRTVIGAIAANLVPPPAPAPDATVAKAPSPIKEIKDFKPQQPSEENVLRTPMRKTVVDQWQATPGNMPSSPINVDAIKAHFIKKETIESKIYDYLSPVLNSEYGDIFRLTIQRKTASLLPEAGLQVDAIKSLSGFIRASLKEDDYGMVQKDLPSILEELVKTAGVLEGYMANPPLHWTDIHGKALLEKKTEEAKKELFAEPVALVEAIDEALNSIGDAFDEYLDKLGLSVDVRRRIRLVREAAKAKAE